MVTLKMEIKKLQESLVSSDKFSVFLAHDEETREQCYRLRYNVFVNELGAEVRGKEAGIDKDKFDDDCQHLIVRDNRTGNIIATTRLLDNDGRSQVGMYYSETEFDLGQVLDGESRFMEVGRTCIHPDYRRGAALAMMWQGLAKLVISQKVDYLIGCASIQLSSGSKYIAAVMQHLREKHFSPAHMRVRPLVALKLDEEPPLPDDVILPTLLKAYMRQGANICGEPYWDAAFGVADVFVLLDCEKITQRYIKHFLERI